jgi:hypothetical protein
MAGIKHKSIYDSNKKISKKYNSKHDLMPEQVNRIIEKLDKKGIK